MPKLKNILGLADIQYSPWQFSFFRIIFGSYLIWHLFLLIPFAPELFSAQGVVPDPMLLPTYKVFPNILVWFDSPLAAQIFVSFLTLLAIAFSVGFYRPLVSLLLWFGWATLFNRNIFIANPGLPMVGWLLLACSLIPTGEPLSFSKKKNDAWKMPAILFWGAWLIAGIGYTVSGIHKLGSPSWVDGTAIHKLLTNPLARDTFLRDLLASAPMLVFKLKTYFSLSLEVLFLPLVIFRWTRPIAWLAVVGMHLGILSLISFADLTLGVLMFHLFTFDSRWIPGQKAKKQPVLFFDGVCGLCSATVDFVISEDHSNRFKFSPLQSQFAANDLDATYVGDLSTLVLKVDDVVFTKSDAALKIASLLGGMWRLFAIFKIIPKNLRNLAYDFIAKNRYRWFGKKETCRLPTAGERAKFIL